MSAFSSICAGVSVTIGKFGMYLLLVSLTDTDKLLGLPPRQLLLRKLKTLSLLLEVPLSPSVLPALLNPTQPQLQPLIQSLALRRLQTPLGLLLSLLLDPSSLLPTL